MIVLAAHGDEEFLRQRDLGDGALVHCERLKQLRSVTNRFGMLHNDAHRTGFGAVGDFDPVATETCKGVVKRVRKKTAVKTRFG